MLCHKTGIYIYNKGVLKSSPSNNDLSSNSRVHNGVWLKRLIVVIFLSVTCNLCQRTSSNNIINLFTELNLTIEKQVNPVIITNIINSDMQKVMFMKISILWQCNKKVTAYRWLALISLFSVHYNYVILTFFMSMSSR